MTKIYYFGAMNGPGHYMHSNPPPRDLTERRALSDFERRNPWGYGIDTKLCPPAKMTEAQVQGRALIHHKDGWTALSFWDRSVDHRGGCCSTFLAEGTHSFGDMISLANEHWPKVMGRFKFPITNATFAPA